MSGIVFITTKGNAKKSFANALQRETGVVKLVVLQNEKKKSLFKRISTFYKKVGLVGIISEIYYFLSVKLSGRKKQALRVLSARSLDYKPEEEYLCETINTDDINEDIVYERIKSMAPDVIVIWGGYILKPRLLEVARFAVNMHFGFVPYYRGVNGVQNAILNDDFEHIGITIHYAVPKVDAGEVIKIIQTDHSKSPEEFFSSLNEKAFREYLEVAKKIFKGEAVQSYPQDLTKGKNFLLKEWTYKKENALADKIIKWSNEYES